MTLYPPLLGLVMIVRDEASRLAAVLDTYRPFVDAITILDTGSTDGTQDIARAAGAELHEEPFLDFSTSRNRVLELHGTRTNFVIMSSSTPLVGGADLRAFLEFHREDRWPPPSAYRVRYRPGCYYQTAVFRTAAGWRYRGRTHEVAVGIGTIGEVIPGVELIRDRDARTTGQWHARWRRDLELLRADIRDTPDDARPMFYLGQTYECLGEMLPALAAYTKRATMMGYTCETYEAMFRRGRVLACLGRTQESDAAYLDAHAFDPRRAEPLYAIAERWHRLENHAMTYLFARRAAELGIPPTDLFVDEDVYTWKAADLVAIHAYYLGDPDAMNVGRVYADVALMARPNDPRIRRNRDFYGP